MLTLVNLSGKTKELYLIFDRAFIRSNSDLQQKGTDLCKDLKR